jgi:hypothetical protein
MMKKIVLGVVVAAIAVSMVPTASASCIPAKNASTYANGGQAYWHSSIPGSDSSTLVGQTWQLGAPGTWNGAGGAVPCADFLYFLPGNPNINLNLNLGGCGAGCPATGSTLAILAQNRGPVGTEFLLATVTEKLTGDTFYDYAEQGDHNMVSLGRPRVASSSRTGTTVNLNVQIPALSGGLYGPNAASAVTGYRILSQSSATNPGRNAASFTTTLATVAAPGGAAVPSTPVTVDCSNIANDQWIVAQLTFENGAVFSNAVSEATQVKCNPALADPKYKIVPKKGVPKNVNPNNQ